MAETYNQTHMSMNIANALKSKKKLTGILVDDGRELSDAEARKYLTECLNNGWRLIPCGDCDNFDYQTGCKGHSMTRAEYEAGHRSIS